MSDLKGRLALVTGSSRGIGRGAVLALARRGCDVAVHYQTLPERAAVVVAELRALGVRAEAFQADMAAGQAEIARLFQEVREKLGHPDVLVTNAGTGCPGDILKVTPEAWEHTMAVHVSAPFYCCRETIPHMRAQRWGRIVNLCSVAGIRGLSDSIAYATAKSAVLNFTQTLARIEADYGIVVNCISPGVIRTDFHKNMTEETKRHNIENRIPIHREGNPEELGEAIAWLAEQTYVVGHNLVMDGGLTMRIA